MELLVGAFAVFGAALLIEVMPVIVSEKAFVLLTLIASAAVTWLLFDEWDRAVIAWGVAIWGLGLALRALFRLVRAWADRTEVANLLQGRNR